VTRRAAEILNVSKRYDRQAALNGVTLDVHRGEIVGLIGPNGAGKTTLLRICAGLLRPTTGTVRVGAKADEAIRYFGGEHTLPPNVSARRWLTLWKSTHAGSAPAQSFDVLSRGTRQRLGLEAMLSTKDATLVLLDEPWEGLDPDASRWLSATLLDQRASGVGVLVSSHRIHDLASVCDRCVFLVGGRLARETVVCARIADHDRSARLFEAFDRSRGER
jgi:ABC-2 type transport system ATP-binding protein